MEKPQKVGQETKQASNTTFGQNTRKMTKQDLNPIYIKTEHNLSQNH